MHGQVGECAQNAVALFETGTPILDALEQAANRVRSKDLHQVIRVLRVFDRTGSNPQEALEQCARTAQKRLEMQAVLAAKMADARVSALIVAVLPALLAASGFLLDRASVLGALETVEGKLLIAFGLLLWLVGAYTTWKISHPRWLQ
jgi:tight adherence protein B